jgi:hypothetical protein
MLRPRFIRKQSFNPRINGSLCIFILSDTSSTILDKLNSRSCLCLVAPPLLIAYQA